MRILFFTPLMSNTVCVAGVGMGGLRLHHQPDSSPRVCASSHAALQQEAVYRWVTCVVCSLVRVWNTHVTAHSITHNSPFPSVQSWSVNPLLPACFSFKHTFTCAFVITKCSTAPGSLSSSIQTLMLIDAFISPTSLLHLTTCKSQAQLIWGYVDLHIGLLIRTFKVISLVFCLNNLSTSAMAKSSFTPIPQKILCS